MGSWYNKYDRVVNDIKEQKRQMIELQKIFGITVIAVGLSTIMVWLELLGLPDYMSIGSLWGVGVIPLFFFLFASQRKWILQRKYKSTLYAWAVEDGRILGEVMEREYEEKELREKERKERAERRQQIWDACEKMNDEVGNASTKNDDV